MSTNRYAAAGWAAILSAAGTLAVLGLSFVFDLSKITGRPEQFGPAPWSLQQAVLVIAVDAAAWILGIYALVKFRDLLRERYNFHAIDHLIWIVIGAGLLVAAASYAQRLAADGRLGSALVGFATMAVLGVLNGVIGIVFGAGAVLMTLGGLVIALIMRDAPGTVSYTHLTLPTTERV